MGSIILEREGEGAIFSQKHFLLLFLAGVEYTFDVGDGYKKPMSKINVLQEDDIPAGYAIWKVTAAVPSFSLPVENEQFVYISRNITAVHFTEYSVLETNIKHNIALNIAGGTNMSVKVMNGIEEETFVAGNNLFPSEPVTDL